MSIFCDRINSAGASASYPGLHYLGLGTAVCRVWSVIVGLGHCHRLFYLSSFGLSGLCGCFWLVETFARMARLGEFLCADTLASSTGPTTGVWFIALYYTVYAELGAVMRMPVCCLPNTLRRAVPWWWRRGSDVTGVTVNSAYFSLTGHEIPRYFHGTYGLICEARILVRGIHRNHGSAIT
jgi:hypothetical protein